MLRRGGLLLAALCAMAPHATDAVSATASLFNITDATQGTCGLRGISTSTDSFKFMASVSAKDAAVSDACARCIKVSKDGAQPVFAFVGDVCSGCPSGQLRLSSSALDALGISLTQNNVPLTYKWSSCPTTMLSGNVRACLMDGAGKWYIPLQFSNSFKPIAKAVIAGAEATQKPDAFVFTANPKNGDALGDSWYKNVEVTLTSKDGETKTGSFAFPGPSGCAEATFQFSATSVADSDEAGPASSSKKGGVLIYAIVGAVCGLLFIVGAIFFVRRRRHARKSDLQGDVENQFMSPTSKKPGSEAMFPIEPTFPNAGAKFDGSQTNQTIPSSDMDISSPYTDFKDANTPQAPSLHASSSSVNTNSHGSAASSSPRQEPAALPVYAHAPKVTAKPKFTFSKPAPEPEQPNNSFRSSYRREGPTVPAPVLPPAMMNQHSTSDDESDGRGSFDIDDMRTTEQRRPQQTFEEVPYSSESAYATAAMTSPQSYVRATTLVRPSNRPPQRDSARYTPPPSTGKVPASSPQFIDEHRDSYASENSQFAASNGPGGYRRDSLGILGYPYARKPSSRSSNITEMQF